MHVDDLTANDIMDPQRYADEGYPYEAWRLLRAQAPVRWFDMGERPGFWAITRREDLAWISKQPGRFTIGPRQAVFADSPPPSQRKVSGPMTRNLLNMDPPEHGLYRAAAADWFTPKAIARLRAKVDRVCAERLDAMAGDGEWRAADFVGELAAPLTLSVLAEMLGVPEDDWPKMFDWTNRFVGAGDPDYQRESVAATVHQAREEMFAYFTDLAAQRRAEPRQDIVSMLVHARLGEGADAKPIPQFELLSYFALLVVAGNETTRNAASGGLLALIDNPDQMQLLRDDVARVRMGVEEIVRWVSPVIQFCRTPSQDLELHGQKIRAGESFLFVLPVSQSRRGCVRCAQSVSDR